MPYREVKNGGPVQNALDAWKRTLRATPGAQTAVRTIGFPGGNERREVIWLRRHPALRIGRAFWAYVGDWFDPRTKINRPWTAYGCVIGDQLPEPLTITVEINPKVSSGFTERFTGPYNGWGCVLVRDDRPNLLFLAHKGGGGGNRSISREEFFERITGIERHGDQWFVLGDVAEQSTVENVVSYVQQVQDLKSDGRRS